MGTGNPAALRSAAARDLRCTDVAVDAAGAACPGTASPGTARASESVGCVATPAANSAASRWLRSVKCHLADLLFLCWRADAYSDCESDMVRASDRTIETVRSARPESEHV